MLPNIGDQFRALRHKTTLLSIKRGNEHQGVGALRPGKPVRLGSAEAPLAKPRLPRQ